MFCTTAGDLPTRRRTRAATIVALCVALLSVAAFGAGPASALTGEDPLLASIPASPNTATTQAPGACLYDQYTSTNWAQNEYERASLNCLINRVRANAHLRQLSFCAWHGTYCENNYDPRIALSKPQMSGLNIAAQIKSQDVMNCTWGTVFPGSTGPAHGACGRDVPYWPKNPNLCAPYAGYLCAPWVSPGWDPPVAENLAAGYPYISARGVVDMWLKSAGHRANLLNPNFAFMGVGVTPGTTHGLMLVPVGTLRPDGTVVKLGDPGTRVGDPGMFWTAMFS